MRDYDNTLHKNENIIYFNTYGIYCRIKYNHE